MSRSSDVLGVLRGLKLVLDVACKNNESYARHIWVNSSVKEALEKSVDCSKEITSSVTKNPKDELEKLRSLLKETIERSSVVLQGVRQYSVGSVPAVEQIEVDVTFDPAQHTDVPRDVVNTSTKSVITDKPFKTPTKLSDVDISSITLKELEDLLAKHGKKRALSLQRDKAPAPEPVPQETKEVPPPKSEIKSSVEVDTKHVENVMKVLTQPSSSAKEIPKLSSVAKQRKVPATRISRMASFGTLFAGLGIGTVSELAKGSLGLGGSQSMKEAFFSPANAERIVDTLCKVRGAALKLGQILSIQDSSIISPQLVKAFERVRQAADYMPDWQVKRVLNSELGSDWRSLLKNFDDKPFAAASIGQVHRGVLPDDMEVAIKIQYPGVAKSIESDIDNLVGMLKIWDVFPAGFFIDNVVKVAKRELTWEVDYIREAEYTEKFGEMMLQYKEYYVPKVIKKLITKNVLTTELVPGMPLDKCFEIEYEERKFIAEATLKLCLRELFQFQCMQTDPNWSNFLYDRQTKRLMLIDFGSTRFYTREFIQNYREVIIAAANGDRQKVLEDSRKMGFLTGYESKQMEEAHVDAVMILGEIFRYNGEFDFGKQNTTQRIAQLVPTMVAHRLCPPPEEIYSIHRKLSGVFLLCSRLNVRLDCRPFYNEIVIGVNS